MKKKLQTTLQYLKQFHVILIAVAVLALFGFTLWQIRPLSNPEPDQSFLQEKRNESDQKTQFKIDKDLKERIEKLSQPTVDVTPKNLGNNNPFNP